MRAITRERRRAWTVVSVTAWCVAAVAASSSASARQAGRPAAQAAEAPAELRLQAAPGARAGVDERGRVWVPINEADYIPMPMPAPAPAGRTPIDPRSGRAVVHDARTGTTVEVEAPAGLALPRGETGGSLTGAGVGVDLETRAFGVLTLLNDPSQFPFRMNCKLFMKFTATTGQQFNFVASGSMVDPETVLTAGHCVYARTATINGTLYTFNRFADEIVVVPGYSNGNEPYGRAYGYNYASWSTWTASGDFNGDVGVIALERGVGFLTGWFGYGYNTDCGFFTGPPAGASWNNFSYPAEGVYNGLFMYGWGGSWDSCVSSNQVRISQAGWGGMSGSGGYLLSGASRTVYCVASNSDRATFINFCRHWQGWFEYVRDTFIPTTSRGAGFDLQPLQCRGGPASVIAGNALTSLNFVLGNSGNGAFSNGTVTFGVYLSTNDIISAGDTLLSSQIVGPGYSLGAASAQTVNCVLPTIPVTTSPGNYYVGILTTNADNNAGNNATVTWDTQPLQVLIGLPTAATGPFPANNAFAVPVFTPSLSWAASARATYYNIYFGTTNPPPYYDFSYSASEPLPALDYNTRYYWRVDAVNSSGTTPGPVWSFTSQKINDSCGGALSVMEDVVYTSNLQNNTASGQGGGCAFNDNIDEWWSYTPSFNGMATVTLCGSPTDTVLSVFADCGGLRVSCDDDYCGFASGSRVRFGARVGSSYLIRVSGYNNARGPYQLLITNDFCPGDSNGDGSVNFLDLNFVLDQYGQTAPNLLGDLNGDGRVDFLDLNIVLTQYGTNCGAAAAGAQPAPGAPKPGVLTPVRASLP